MITEDEFWEMCGKEWFCMATPNHLVNELYSLQRSGQITRLRHRFDKLWGCYDVIFTLVDKNLFPGFQLNLDDFTPEYHEFIKMRWVWVDKSQKDKKK